MKTISRANPRTIITELKGIKIRAHRGNASMDVSTCNSSVGTDVGMIGLAKRVGLATNRPSIVVVIVVTVITGGAVVCVVDAEEGMALVSVGRGVIVLENWNLLVTDSTACQ